MGGKEREREREEKIKEERKGKERKREDKKGFYCGYCPQNKYQMPQNTSNEADACGWWSIFSHVNY